MLKCCCLCMSDILVSMYWLVLLCASNDYVTSSVLDWVPRGGWSCTHIVGVWTNNTPSQDWCHIVIRINKINKLIMNIFMSNFTVMYLRMMLGRIVYHIRSIFIYTFFPIDFDFVLCLATNAISYSTFFSFFDIYCFFLNCKLSCYLF